MSRRDVCITGAGGFIGSTLAAGFAALGWQVSAVDRHFDDHTRQRLAGVDLVTIDLGEGRRDALPACRALVHAAAITTDPADLGWSPAEHVAANLRPLLTVLESASRTRPDTVVLLSSSGVFAPADGHDALTDSDRPSGESPYALAKRTSERLAPSILRGGSAVHVVRLGYLYGPYETARPSRTRVSAVAQWVMQARRGHPLQVRADDPRRDWTYAPDLAAALVRLIDGGAAPDPVHLGSPYVLTDRAMATLVAGHVRGARLATMAVDQPLKPPMQPSDIPILRGFTWTPPAAGLSQMMAAEVAA